MSTFVHQVNYIMAQHVGRIVLYYGIVLWYNLRILVGFPITINWESRQNLKIVQ